MKLCRFSVFFEILVSRRKFDVPSISIAPIPCTEPPNHPTQCKNRDSSGPKNWDACSSEVLWGVVSLSSWGGVSLSSVVTCVVKIFYYLHQKKKHRLVLLKHWNNMYHFSVPVKDYKMNKYYIILDWEFA